MCARDGVGRVRHWSCPDYLPSNPKAPSPAPFWREAEDAQARPLAPWEEQVLRAREERISRRQQRIRLVQISRQAAAAPLSAECEPSSAGLEPLSAGCVPLSAECVPLSAGCEPTTEESSGKILFCIFLLYFDFINIFFFFDICFLYFNYILSYLSRN